MAGFPVLNTIQPIIGVDLHRSIPPIPPVLTPHVVVWGVGLSQKTQFMWAVSTSKASTRESGCTTPVAVGCGHGCGRTHDAGPHLGHIWPNVLLPLIALGSASKSEFGSGSVKIATGSGAADMAVNVAYILNYNLQCQDFPIPPLPTGDAITMLYSVKADFTLADLARGALQMAADMALTWLVGLACAGVSSVVSGLASGSGGSGIAAAFKNSFNVDAGMGLFAESGRSFAQNMKTLLTALPNAWKAAPGDRSLDLLGAAISTFGLGTPTGYSPSYTPVGGLTGNAVANWIDGLFR